MDQCKLCRRELKKAEGVGGLPPVRRLECPTCGVYEIDNVAASFEPEPFIKERLYLISAVARWMSDRDDDNVLRVDKALLKDRSEFEARILNMCPRTTQEKMDCILAYIAEQSIDYGEQIILNIRRDYPLLYCKGHEQLNLYIEYLRLRDLVRVEQTDSFNPILKLTMKGWQKVEEQAKPNIKSKQAFVAMWFNDEVKSAYSEGIAKLEEDTGFSMLRIDMTQFNDKICDKILAEIRRSRFVIADVTGHRQGVYFEAGFAMGLGLPVIWTCRQDQIEECHFDTRQYNHIPWDNANELREKLRDRILATIGEAPK